MDRGLKLYGSDFSASESRNSSAMKKIMGNEEVAHVLNSRQKQQKFYDTLKKYKGSERAVQQALYELKHDLHDGINAGEANAIGKELVKHGNRFVRPRNFGSREAEEKRSFRSRPAFLPTLNERPMPTVSPGVLARSSAQTYAKRNATIMNTGLIKPTG